MSTGAVREIGERLRSIIKEEPELPLALRRQLERLRKSEASRLAVGHAKARRS
ncbi:hypothetical protein [Bradyrhizobium yuanmingense]|uniref:hypothetical protein n=1 Tax=Bradyrhizobium yuanmingense TaxID=108015 RepID=UPI0023BA2847|nr:hypothetical protein [Bradyrhizobium yuanmingense]MDF0498169.1 hypothetical protein [Bradyrhizobium yuanmingense]